LLTACVAGATIVDFDFHGSSGFIYWADITSSQSRYLGSVKKLNVHRIKPDGSDYADIVTVTTMKSYHGISALAINWLEGIIWLLFYVIG